MKLRILSDLHLELQDWHPPPAQTDMVVLAGDIHNGVAGLEWARRHFAQTPIIYVPGNHEFYDGELGAVLTQLRAAADALGIHLLDQNEVTTGGVRILGATLWTDFALDGDTPQDVARAMAMAQQIMVDYRAIRLGQRLLQPADTRELHAATVAWLERALGTRHSGPTVVVTHHLPHRGSVHPRFAGSPVNPAFASDLARLVRRPADLWIHGHTHESMDYRCNGTRVVCNPRGYVSYDLNHAFDPGLVIEVGA